VVSGISGPLWWTVKLKGMAGHTGSVPMPIRKDALIGAAEIIVAVNEIATQVPEQPTVGTVGTIQVFPASRNIIPEEVIFTVDLRDIDLDRRNRYEKQLRDRIESITQKTPTHYTKYRKTPKVIRVIAPIGSRKSFTRNAMPYN
jgi:allantoate deiminase